jgi:PAS domain S-box-containing protein
MTIPQRILLHVAVGAVVVITVATTVTYGIVYDAAKQRDLKHLETYVRERARREEMGFRQVEINLNLVRGQFLKRMEGPNPRNLEGQWNDRFELFPDGAWRSRTNFMDGRKYSTLWAHKDATFTPELKIQILRAQNICDELLPGWVDEFPSVYFVLPGWLNVGFDPRIPAWVWDTPADYNATNLEWFELAMPKQPPADRFAWTGVIEEPTTKVPIVSAYLPIIKDGRFLGSLGHDKYVNRTMDEITRSDLPGARHVIFRADGRIMAHPTKLKEILASKGLLRMQNSGEPELASLYRAVISRTGRHISGFDEGSGSYYSVARLAGPEWFFLTTMPRELLQRQAFQSAQWVLWSGLVSLALVLAFLAATLRRQIARPLAELSRATKQMSAGDNSARANVTCCDEFGALADSFNEMAGRVEQRDAELQAEKAALERRVVERTAELRESEARFANAFRRSPAMQSLLRATDRVLVEVNDTFLNKFGFAHEEVVGKTASQVNFWVEPEELKAFGLELESKGFVVGREVRLRARDGRVLTVLLSTQPVDIGGVPHFLSAGVDITPRKEAEAKLLESERQLRESEARVRALYESLSEAAMVHDESGFLEINSACVKLFGAQRPEQIIGKHPGDVSLPEQPGGESSFSAAQRHMARALTEGTHRFEWVCRKLDGTDFPVEVTLTAVELEGRRVMQAVVLDLTERKRAEAELQNALARERELSQLKSEFVSLVSHEFRTPLEIILSSADNLRRYHDRLEPERREQLLQTIHKAVRRMSGMMEEVLVLGRLETDRMTFNPVPFDLRAFCQRVCEEIESATGRRCPIRLAMNGVPANVAGDESVLRHIFGNLLANAVKYSSQGSEVEFTVARDGGDAICRILDRGCGIPSADQKRLFQAFHRGSNVGQIPGTGLGLLIVQRCVVLHGGEIQFESVEGEGTTFTVTLPLFSLTLTPAPAPSAESRE